MFGIGREGGGHGAVPEAGTAGWEDSGRCGRGRAAGSAGGRCARPRAPAAQEALQGAEGLAGSGSNGGSKGADAMRRGGVGRSLPLGAQLGRHAGCARGGGPGQEARAGGGGGGRRVARFACKHAALHAHGRVRVPLLVGSPTMSGATAAACDIASSLLDLLQPHRVTVVCQHLCCSGACDFFKHYS